MNDLIIFTLVFTAPLIIFCIICFAKGVSQTKKITALTAVNLIAIYTALSLSKATHSSFQYALGFVIGPFTFFPFCFYQFPFRAKKGDSSSCGKPRVDFYDCDYCVDSNWSRVL